MLNRILMFCLCLGGSLSWAESAMDAEAFFPYEEVRQLIVRGAVNVVMGGDSKLNIVEYDPDLVEVVTLPGDVIEVKAKQSFRSFPEQMPTVVVRSNNRFSELYRLSVRDHSSLIAKEIESMSLSLEVKTSGHVMVEGIMNLHYLNVTDSSNVEIYWVNSHNLDVNVEKGNVVLAGRVDSLTMKAKAEANIEAAGLVAKHSWVSAIQNSQVSIFPTKELFVYSKDQALVDVKHKPDTYAPVNQAPSAVVLNYIEMERRQAAH